MSDGDDFVDGSVDGLWCGFGSDDSDGEVGAAIGGEGEVGKEEGGGEAAGMRRDGFAQCDGVEDATGDDDNGGECNTVNTKDKGFAKTKMEGAAFFTEYGDPEGEETDKTAKDVKGKNAGNHETPR